MVYMQKRMTAAILSVFIMIGLAAAGCSQAATSGESAERVLRIAVYQYGSDDEWFRQQYTDLFEFANPGVTVEIVPAVEYNPYAMDGGSQGGGDRNDPAAVMTKLIQSDNPPDVVMMEYAILPSLVEENLLLPLDSYIAKDRVDLSRFVPAVQSSLKQASQDGRLYALAPQFSSSALFYNRELFDRLGVAYPKDHMTWDELFALARQVSQVAAEVSAAGSARTYGFSFSTYKDSDPYWDMEPFTQPLQLYRYDEAGDRMTVNTEEWESVWSTFADLRRTNVIPGSPQPDENGMNRMWDPIADDYFLSGNVAMVLASSYYVNELESVRKAAETNTALVPVSWNVVTQPVHPEAPEVGSRVDLIGLMGIGAKAQNPDDAWEFIKFIHGGRWAKLKSGSQNVFSTLAEYNKPRGGADYNISAFMQLKPAYTRDESNLYRKYPDLFSVEKIGRNKFQEVLEGKKAARQALQEWQTEGDAMLERMRESMKQAMME
ncbi:ABC transporter substrate-binding protein [Paenibacillus thermotolerans]|uniref:ABC transporter substrate-binding protein n=1 Tax=Paenibacillus thermotolerans TaxID=3027807 RepID=UPI002368196C|nr:MULTISPECIES: extracellular solute-binding protein [unclassified Paenibacillus]